MHRGTTPGPAANAKLATEATAERIDDDRRSPCPSLTSQDLPDPSSAVKIPRIRGIVQVLVPAHDPGTPLWRLNLVLDRRSVCAIAMASTSAAQDSCTGGGGMNQDRLLDACCMYGYHRPEASPRQARPTRRRGRPRARPRRQRRWNASACDGGGGGEKTWLGATRGVDLVAMDLGAMDLGAMDLGTRGQRTLARRAGRRVCMVYLYGKWIWVIY
ncbi:hypothetical protein MKEN_00192700 [Mycena kentingensis (nom. inval.)]|nr:hypothetical protein MKEN_00192700 [Mycena kentingensis (nom. inval.)]